MSAYDPKRKSDGGNLSVRFAPKPDICGASNEFRKPPLLRTGAVVQCMNFKRCGQSLFKPLLRLAQIGGELATFIRTALVDDPDYLAAGPRTGPPDMPCVSDWVTSIFCTPA